jgi:hypothetical protein
VVPFVPSHDKAVAERFGIETPFLEVNFDFCLVKAS